MAAIYEPRGKALEYSPLACNLYRGCGHGCKYCYAPACLRLSLQAFTADPQPRAGIIEALGKDAARLRGTDKTVLLSFTSDPYQPIDTAHRLTRSAISTLRRYQVPVTILTKGGARSTVDFDLLTPGRDTYAATLTFVNIADSQTWEPGAALPMERVAALTEAHRLGLQTWASLEPVIDPLQSLELIRRTVDVVDLFKLGKWNHDTRANEIDWRDYARRAIAICDEHHRPYYVKEDLRPYLSN